MKRPTVLETAMQQAEIAAQRSHDAETQVGAVLLHPLNNAIIGTGCNGFVRGAPDNDLPNTRPLKYPYVVHAEENLIANCARLGIKTDGATCVCTHTPCVRCMRLLFQCGVKRIICKQKYTGFEELKTMRDIKITETQITSGDSTFIQLDYTPRHLRPRVLFVGLNPSCSSPTDEAFALGTKSRATIDSWIHGLDAEVAFANVCNQKTANNKALLIGDIWSDRDHLQKITQLAEGVDLVIALGSQASKILGRLSIDHLEMPHPSGRNRFWNNENDKRAAISVLRDEIEDVRKGLAP